MSTRQIPPLIVWLALLANRTIERRHWMVIRQIIEQRLISRTQFLLNMFSQGFPHLVFTTKRHSQKLLLERALTDYAGNGVEISAVVIVFDVGLHTDDTAVVVTAGSLRLNRFRLAERTYIWV
jgi:hypothetical protein